MPGTHNFLQWNPGAVNQETDVQYSADSQRSGGAVNPSILASRTANKLFFQVSAFIKAFADAMAAKGYSLSDANITTLAGVFANIMTAADMTPYAPLNAPVLVNPVTNSTPISGDSSNKIPNTVWIATYYATMAWVSSYYAPLANAGLTGAPTAPTPALTDNSTHIATTNFVKSLGYALLTSPAFSGVPTAPTPAQADNSTTIATTAFVKNQAFQSSLGFTPVQQGGGANQTSADKVYIGWDPSSGLPRVQVNSTDFGPLATTNWVTTNFTQLSEFSPRSYGNPAGYARMPGGLIIQWGQARGSTSGPAVNSFPMAFPNTCLVMTATPVDTGAAYITLTGWGATQFTVSGDWWGQSTAGARLANDARFIAIGY